MALQGFVSSAEAYVFSKKSRAVWRGAAGGLRGGGTVCPQRKPSLHASFHSPFPHFHDHWYALRGCRNTWWLTGGTPYWGDGGGVGGGGGCACPLRLSFPRLLFFCSSPRLCLLRQDSSPKLCCVCPWPRPRGRHEWCLESAGRLKPSAPPRPP